MTQSRLRISLVIPAYNEESYLEACLDSALAQAVPFHEIIVVDNNSSDKTGAMARRFTGVKVLTQPRQGVVHARNLGFDAASGDIIARIDADTRLPTDWTLHVERAFQTASTAAVTGKVSYYETSFARLLSWSDSLARRLFSHLLGKHMALQGANMALRRSVWQDVRPSVCSKPGLHEDFDLAIHIVEAGHQVRYDPKLEAAVAFRQAAGSFGQFISYYWHCPSTYTKHGIRKGYILLPMALAIISSYPVLHLLSRSYARRSSTQRPVLRVNPSTFVD
jgi:glycosyltransferase involved in cell wall biosynthesis